MHDKLYFKLENFFLSIFFFFLTFQPVKGDCTSTSLFYFSLSQGPWQHNSCESLTHPDVPCESLGATRLTGGSGEGVVLDTNATWTQHVFFFSSVGSSECFQGCVMQKNAPPRHRLTVRKRSKFPAVGALLHLFQCLATALRGPYRGTTGPCAL